MQLLKPGPIPVNCIRVCVVRRFSCERSLYCVGIRIAQALNHEDEIADYG